MVEPVAKFYKYRYVNFIIIMMEVIHVSSGSLSAKVHVSKFKISTMSFFE